MAGTTTTSIETTKGAEDVRHVLVQHNNAIIDIATLLAASVGTGNVTVITPTVGTTVTIAVPTSNIQIAGIPVLVAALTAQVFGALGTIPASTWGLIALERVAAGTMTFVSAAANYTTGYATEALAIAAIPAITAAKVRVGYVTIKASASTWIAGTDGLADGSGGNVATTTNYYPGTGLYAVASYVAAKVGDRTGTAITA